MVIKKWFVGRFVVISDTKWEAYLLTTFHDRLPEDVKAEGIFVDELPADLSSDTQISMGVFYNPVNGALWREYAAVDNTEQ